MKLDTFTKYAWGVLLYNIFVVLWGAYVRATGSGAGCGSHWPLCNGEILPRDPQIETLIEFSHRLSSGLALLLVIILFIWSFRRYPRGKIVRLGSSLSLIFIITEALVGAGLVLFEWVAEDASIGRAISTAIHLINTFLLLGALSLTAWWASGGRRVEIKGSRLLILAVIIGFVGVLFIGISGAVTALGDTLFPVESFAEGLEQDFSESSHFLIRLRVWHPVIAIIVGLYLIFLSLLLGMFKEDQQTKRFAIALSGLFIAQLIAGVINLALLAPVWMQIIHLFLADLVWITLILLAANTYAIDPHRVDVDQSISKGFKKDV